MIDTNQLAQVVNDAKTVHATLADNWPAICAVAVIAARELRNFNAWLAGLAGFVIQHGGIFMIVKKLIWNPEVKS